jgi:hypothetical protein
MQKARRLRWDQVKYAFFSGGPLTFKVEWIAEHDLPFKNPTTLVFKWDGSWRLTRILCHKNLDKDEGGDSPPSTPVTLQEENLRTTITRNYSCPRIHEFRHVGLDKTGSVYLVDCGNAIYQVFVNPKGVMTADFACGDGWQCGINSGN